MLQFPLRSGLERGDARSMLDIPTLFQFVGNMVLWLIHDINKGYDGLVQRFYCFQWKIKVAVPASIAEIDLLHCPLVIHSDWEKRVMVSRIFRYQNIILNKSKCIAHDSI